jgi:hypothetical protein
MPKLKAIHDTTNLEFIEVNFHTQYPGLDSMFLVNATEQQQRFDKYGVAGTPWSQINGDFPVGTGPLAMFWNTFRPNFDNSLAPGFNLSINQASSNDTFFYVKATVTLTLAYATTDSFVLHLYLIDDLVEESSYTSPPGYNSETAHHNVFRKCLTPVEGIAVNSSSIGVAEQFEVTDVCNYTKSSGRSVVGFIQNVNTNEVMNATTQAFSSSPLISYEFDTITQLITTFDTIYLNLFDTQYVFGTPIAPTVEVTNSNVVTTTINPTSTSTVSLATSPIETTIYTITTNSSTALTTTTFTTTTTIYVLVNSVYEVQNSPFVIQPNPIHNSFSIQNNEACVSLKIINTQGSEIKKWEASTGLFSIEELAVGIYYVVIIDNSGKKWMQKIIKN